MKTSASQKIKIGLFTIAGILLFVAGIFFIGSKKNMFSDTFLIYGTFKNVGGLEVGNNIRFAGINVGTVKDIQIMSDTVVRIDMSMHSKVRPFLKRDAMATIGSDGLMGDKLVTIVSGSPNETKLLRDGDRINTANPLEIDKVVSQFIRVATNAETVTRELAGMAIQIRAGKGSLSSLLYSNKLSNSLEKTAENAENMTGSLSVMAAQIKSGKGSVGNLLYTSKLSDGLDHTVTTANGAMLTIKDAAYDFGQNMKALQGNAFLKGYFKRKAREEAKMQNVKDLSAADSTTEDLNEAQLKEIIADAQKALEEKRQLKNK